MPQQHHLPDILPREPMPLFASWFEEALRNKVQPNPDAMVLATIGESGRPAARVVLCKRIEVEPGYIVFFTNYRSRKGRELAANPVAATVFHWDQLHRQVRIEGRVVTSPAEESDRYFASRAVDSRVGAWASEQSEPLASRDLLAERVREAAARFGVTPGAASGEVPRPPHWGGYRLWIESIELWIEGPNRVHDRAVWKRTLVPDGESAFSAGEWEATRLYP